MKKKDKMAQPIHWKRSKPYHVPKPKKFWTLNRTMSIICSIGIILTLMFVLTSCSITKEQAELEYKIDKLYLEYSYERDSLILEHNK